MVLGIRSLGKVCSFLGSKRSSKKVSVLPYRSLPFTFPLVRDGQDPNRDVTRGLDWFRT